MSIENEEDGKAVVSAATNCYAAGWRPEATLKQTVLDMVEIVFDESASIDECEMAASTIVEIIHPEIMAKATEDERRLWDAV